MGFRSSTCCSRGTGKPLMAYPSEYEADQQAQYSARIYQTQLEPYKCDRCRYWHLAPRVERFEYCYRCVGRNRQPKLSYPSEEAAEDNAERIPTSARLRAYPCPCGDGWHLTSKW